MGVTGSNPRGNRKPRAAAAAPRRGKAAPRRPAPAPRSDLKLKVTIPSNFVAGREVQKKILDAVDRAGFNSQSAFAIKLALEEALVNAIKHGNRLDPDKTVKIEAIVTPTQAEIIIEDQGPGFDRACVPDPTRVENIEKCSGRGILLMEAYMSGIEWSRNGRRVRMIKKNEDDLLPRS